MAQSDGSARFRELKLDTNADGLWHAEYTTNDQQKRPERPSFNDSPARQDTVRAAATPPIEIPGQQEEAVSTEDTSSFDLLRPHVSQLTQKEHAFRPTKDGDRSNTRHRHSVLEPARQHGLNGLRGRSLAQAISEQRAMRSQSESDRSHYDPHTGRQLPEFSESPPVEQAHTGEPRFPLLQGTVDELARQHNEVPHLTTASTMSPAEEAVITPSDTDNQYLTSPVNISPAMARFSTSYESPRRRPGRKASERWKDGETAPDFFSRAGSLKNLKGHGESIRRSSRRDTQSSLKSSGSVASSYLHRYMGAGGDDAPLAVDAEGVTVGEDYVLGKQIGYGGFSIIREVQQMSAQTGTQRTLAVKIVKKKIDGKDKIENSRAQMEFEHEVDLWRLLNHKHILNLEAIYQLQEATFCFVPLNTGGTLFDVVRHHPDGLPADLAANYCYQVASGLRYLHLDARVVHRDVKLENCLVDITNGEPGLVRICDFGLAEWIDKDSDSNTEGSVSSDVDRERPLNRYFGPSESSSSAFAGGSLEYAAPEILQLATRASGRVQPGEIPPEKSLISPAVDIWAMGVCFYAMLMGRRPFQDSFQPRVVMAILAGEYNKADLKAKVSEHAYHVVKKCLDKEALRRPQISKVYESPWFDEARSSYEGSDAESESARANGGWRL